jgi:hypothetical protein
MIWCGNISDVRLMLVMGLLVCGERRGDRKFVMSGVVSFSFSFSVIGYGDCLVFILVFIVVIVCY